MIVTTTPSVEGRRVTEYLGLVTGEVILGANVVRDFLASVRDVVGGRSGSYEKVLRHGRDAALEEMAEEETWVRCIAGSFQGEPRAGRSP